MGLFRQVMSDVWSFWLILLAMPPHWASWGLLDPQPFVLWSPISNPSIRFLGWASKFLYGEGDLLVIQLPGLACGVRVTPG